MTIRVTIPTVPVAQPRQRHAVRGGFAVNYVPRDHPVTMFKASVQLAVSEVWSGAPLDGPLELRAIFVFPRTKQQTWKTKPMPRLPHCKKPDVDNLMKSLADALNGLLFVDDSQIVDVRCIKWIAAGDEQPHVELTVTEFGH